MEEPETIEPEYLEIKKEHEIRIDDNKIKIEMNNNEIIFALIIDLSFNKYIKRYKYDSFKKEFEIPKEAGKNNIYNKLVNYEYEINEKEKKLIINDISDKKEIKLEEEMRLTNEEMIKKLISEIKNMKKEKSELEKQVNELDNIINKDKYKNEINLIEQKNKDNKDNETKKNPINNNNTKNESQTNKSPVDNSTEINQPKKINKTSNKGEKQLINLDEIAMGKDKSTTVMIRNIPNKYTDTILKDALIEFEGKYNCLYLPFDYEKKINKGYAFIDFVNPLHILYFYEKFNGKRWDQLEGNKICELTRTHFQGINEMQKHANNYLDQKNQNFYMNKNEANENMIIPSKYLPKLIKRFPKMKYTENEAKKIINVKSFE